MADQPEMLSQQEMREKMALIKPVGVRGRSLDDVLYDAFRQGYLAGVANPEHVTDSVEISEAFADWRRTLR